MISTLQFDYLLIRKARDSCKVIIVSGWKHIVNETTSASCVQLIWLPLFLRSTSTNKRFKFALAYPLTKFLVKQSNPSSMRMIEGVFGKPPIVQASARATGTRTTFLLGPDYLGNLEAGVFS